LLENSPRFYHEGLAQDAGNIHQSKILLIREENPAMGGLAEWGLR